ncbi:unnamed protein product [Nyctereutes procyonoides]|uniref:(raccoon dog) hypothetical protein n=1 Tax=Nyctereutes procyonoides TaxID=34880 RepID=A0A811YJ14_NYCPR|nr:unnamed protein product [Nyctereutes procyonoides]
MLDRGWGLVQRKCPDSEPTRTQSTAQPQQAAGYSWRPIAIGEPSSTVATSSQNTETNGRESRLGSERVRRLDHRWRRRGGSWRGGGRLLPKCAGDVTFPRAALQDDGSLQSGCKRDPLSPGKDPPGGTRAALQTSPRGPSARSELLKPDANEPNTLIKNGRRTRTDLQPPPPSRVTPPPPSRAPQPHSPAGSPPPPQPPPSRVTPPPPSRAPPAPLPSRVTTTPPSHRPVGSPPHRPAGPPQQGPPSPTPSRVTPPPPSRAPPAPPPAGTQRLRHGRPRAESVVDTCCPRRWVTQAHGGRGPALGQVGGPWGHPAEEEKSEVV